MKKIKSIALAAGILAAVSSIASAQTNVVMETNVVTVLVTNVVTVTNVVAAAPAPAPAASAKDSWKSSVSAGLTLTRGNSDSTLLSIDFLTAKKTPKDEYTIGGDITYGTQNSQSTANSDKAFTQWNHLFSDRFFAYGRADALRDVIANLKYRFSIGPGAGYYLVKETNNTLAFEAGGALQVEDLGNQQQTFATVRLAERAEHIFDDKARVWQSVELLPQINKVDNYVVNFEIGVEAPVYKSLSMKIYLDDTYANEPAPGRQKNDSKIVGAVSYSF